MSIDPPPGTTRLILEPKIQVRFNQAMDQPTIESAFTFKTASPDDGGVLVGSFEWGRGWNGFRLRAR